MDKDFLRSRFAGRLGTSSDRIIHGPKEVIAPGAQFADAAVLIPLLVGDEGVDVLLTQRATHLKHHPGQVSFPGGRREGGDRSLEETALRETHEETGIAPEYVEIIGHLPRMYTISAYDVDPVVALVNPGYTITPDASEVDKVFSVPFDFLADDRHRIDTHLNFAGARIPMVEWHYEEQRIWGATAAMLVVLIDTLRARAD